MDRLLSLGVVMMLLRVVSMMRACICLGDRYLAQPETSRVLRAMARVDLSVLRLLVCVIMFKVGLVDLGLADIFHSSVMLGGA